MTPQAALGESETAAERTSALTLFWLSEQPSNLNKSGFFCLFVFFMTVNQSGRCGSVLLPEKLHSLEFSCNSGFSVSRALADHRRLGTEKITDQWQHIRAWRKLTYYTILHSWGWKSNVAFLSSLRGKHWNCSYGSFEVVVLETQRLWFIRWPLRYAKVSLSKILNPRVFLCKNMLAVASSWLVEATIAWKWPWGWMQPTNIISMLQHINQFTTLK